MQESSNKFLLKFWIPCRVYFLKINEDGLLYLETFSMRPTSQKYWFSLWLNCNLKGNSRSKVDFCKTFEEYGMIGEGGKAILGKVKTKALRKNKEE